ncbi:hypothetical protein HNR39_003751 [Glaciimonas immobilis]|uniref:Uncharacterized protein n=1 Tax=Glaciimonas immobilis TaxID=728004 RepID=A0A840RZW1_9BURK|nr:hypothetical protein [Glaciimonas immobilis]
MLWFIAVSLAVAELKRYGHASAGSAGRRVALFIGITGLMCSPPIAHYLAGAIAFDRTAPTGLATPLTTALTTALPHHLASI